MHTCTYRDYRGIMSTGGSQDGGGWGGGGGGYRIVEGSAAEAVLCINHRASI